MHCNLYLGSLNYWSWKWIHEFVMDQSPKQNQDNFHILMFHNVPVFFFANI